MKNWRQNLIFILIVLFSVVIISRLIYLQIFQKDFYQALSQGLHNNLSNEVANQRGEIFLKNGEPLAINKNFFLVFAVPKKVPNLEETAKSLSEILDLPEELILEKLKKDTLYSPIKVKLNEEEIEKLKKLGLAGIYLTGERWRYYPQESLASQVVGFLDKNNQGRYGLEEYYDEILKGKSKGKDLILTIDYNIQFKAERLLEEAKEKLNIERGQIIVLDPNSGRIIALAHFPNFNPNSYQEYAQKGELAIFKNRITRDLFEPGSVFKPIIFAAGLNEGEISPQTTYIDEGKVKIGGYTIYNYGNRVYGEQTMTNVLEKSINTGAVFVERLLPNHIFLDYLERFGIFEKTGIDLPETYSENREFKKGYEINFATASFGQGIEMTPIQLARAYCAIANGGKLIRPYLVENLDHSDFQPPKIISQKTSSQLTAMLVSVVENGFAKRAKIPGYYIAGKTGTAQVSFSALGIKKPGYSEKTIQTFVGYFPAFNPKFLILVKLDNPKTKTAEYSAVPVFHDLAEYIINYYQIPPDYEL